MFGSTKIQTGSKWKSKPGLNIKIDYDVNVWSQKKDQNGSKWTWFRKKIKLQFETEFDLHVWLQNQCLSKDPHGSRRGKPQYCDRTIDLIKGAVDTFQVAGVTQGRGGVPWVPKKSKPEGETHAREVEVPSLSVASHITKGTRFDLDPEFWPGYWPGQRGGRHGEGGDWYHEFFLPGCLCKSLCTPLEKLLGDGFSTPMPLLGLICTIISNKTCILD